MEMQSQQEQPRSNGGMPHTRTHRPERTIQNCLAEKQNAKTKTKNMDGMDFVYHILCRACIDTFEFIRDILCAAGIFETHSPSA